MPASQSYLLMLLNRKGWFKWSVVQCCKENIQSSALITINAFFNHFPCLTASFWLYIGSSVFLGGKRKKKKKGANLFSLQQQACFRCWWEAYCFYGNKLLSCNQWYMTKYTMHKNSNKNYLCLGKNILNTICWNAVYLSTEYKKIKAHLLNHSVKHAVCTQCFFYWTCKMFKFKCLDKLHYHKGKGKCTNWNNP